VLMCFSDAVIGQSNWYVSESGFWCVLKLAVSIGAASVLIYDVLALAERWY
jgi:hypothetical protein